MKINVKPISKEKFHLLVNNLKAPEYINNNHLYNVYEMVIDGIDQVFSSIDLSNFIPVNQVVVILYVINEFIYTLNGKTHEEIDKYFENEENYTTIASLCADKYLTNEQLNFKSKAYLSRFNPPISTLELYLNFSLRTLENLKPNNQIDKLIYDMLIKAFKLAKCIISLLIDGFETEAFSTWRTLHENESILICLLNGGTDVFNEYFKHIKYALAYRGQIPDKEKVDEIFVEIKSEMKKHDLKSKDMKKFIEYGYLFKFPNLVLNEDFKLNFRDGVQKIAGLSMYSKTYETASEIAHSSPLLLFSRRDYFFNITIINLYETFFRLERVFANFYKNGNKENFSSYQKIREVYITQLTQIYERIQNSFLKKH